MSAGATVDRYTMNRIIVLSLFLDFLSRLSAQKSYPQINHRKGNIVGTWKLSSTGKHYEAYEGIPYAQPPVDGLRFEPPIKYLSWPTPHITLLAKTPGQRCLQYDDDKQEYRGDEDCLFLNVYRPKGSWQGHHLLPVIFYIHGDDFQSGSGADHGPKYLIDKDVIVVTINYRLGPLGFMSTQDDVVPGNMGLKDQALALQWVSLHIIIFGGDNRAVTIFGHGAGGASVHYHYLSKQSQSMFRKGMSLSGSALAPWAHTEGSAKKAKALACALKCTTANTYDMVQCLKKEPGIYIVQAALKFRKYPKIPFAEFGPVVEHTNGAFTFISRWPGDIIVAGDAQKVPWIAGFVSGEGLSVAAGILEDEALLDKVEDKWDSAAPVLLDYVYSVKSSHVANVVRDHFFGGSSFRSNITKFVNMFGDRMFVNSVVLGAVLHADRSTAPARLFKFSYRGARSFVDIKNHGRAKFGPASKDLLAYVFDMPVDMSTTLADRKMRTQMIDFWVSYARDQFSQPDVPGLDWAPLRKKKESINFLHIIDPCTTKLESDKKIGDRFFWRSLKLGEKHYPSYE